MIIIRRVSQKQMLQAKRLYWAGRTYAEIGKVMGVHPQRANKYLRILDLYGIESFPTATQAQIRRHTRQAAKALRDADTSSEGPQERQRAHW